MSEIVERARELRSVIEELAVNLDDEKALDSKELFPYWNAEAAYEVGARVRFEDTLYKCLQAHQAQADWTPTAAPSLWAKVLIPDPEVVPVWEQPDSTNPYMKGDRVHYPTADDPIYESLIDNNTWSPEAYPAGWQVVTE
jgi:hypothetical protein